MFTLGQAQLFAEAKPGKPVTQALITGTDEIENDAFLTDSTWATLEAHYSQEQIFDLIFLVGQYRGLAGALNSLGVQLDDGLKGF